MATYKTTAPARDVAVAGSHVFLVIGAPSETPREFKDQEVLILNIPSETVLELGIWNLEFVIRSVPHS